MWYYILASRCIEALSLLLEYTSIVQQHKRHQQYVTY
jgi:hypothetical protein